MLVSVSVHAVFLVNILQEIRHINILCTLKPRSHRTHRVAWRRDALTRVKATTLGHYVYIT